MQQPRMWKVAARFAFLVLGSAVLLVASGGTAFAQLTGKVIGNVTDRDTRQPLAGAQVIVEGTNLGNVSNEDGYYFINNVPVGVRRVTAQYLGYQTLTREDRILSGVTSTIDFALASEVVRAEAIVATIEREPLLIRDNTVSKTRFNPERIQSLPVGGLAALVELSAGVYNGTTGLIVRGGRGTEAATYVDGALVTDFASQARNTQIGGFGVEEVDVITGGFNAEFGHAQSGIVNIATRDGGQAYHGSLRFTTDGRFSTDGYTPEELATDGATRSLNQEKCCGFNSLQATISGPIAGEKLTFFASADVSGAADGDPRSGGFNPALGRDNSSGSTKTVLPGARSDNTRFHGKLTSFLTGTSKLTGAYLFSRSQDEQYADAQSGILQFFSRATRIKTNDAIVGYDQRLYRTSERELNLQIRANWHKTELAFGVPVSPEQSAFLTAFDPVTAALCGSDCTGGDTFEDDFLNYRFHDIKFYFEDRFIPGGVTPEQKAAVGCLCPILLPVIAPTPSARTVDPDPIFGVAQIWRTEGFTSNMTVRDEERQGIRVDLDGQLNRVHRAKAGVEYTTIDLSQIAGNFDSPQNSAVYFAKPRVGAGYVQDRLDYGDLVIDLGLRLDWFDPNVTFPRVSGVVDCSISNFPVCTAEAETVEADRKTALAPRMGVAHPITDKTQVRLSYGRFHQLPELRNFYSSFATDFSSTANNPNILYGNPNLDYVETTAFEAGITHLITENLLLDVVGYNRDRRGAIRLDVFQGGTAGTQDERRIFVNGDNGNVKGFDITLSKRYANYFSSDLAWSLQWARGTTSSPTEWATGGGFGRLFDPLNPGVLLPPPTELQPESFDRLHNINWQFALRFPGDFREGTTVGTLLQNLGTYLVYNAHSGEPFTRRATTGQSEPLEDIGGSRLPWVHSGDIRVTKGLNLLGSFGFEVFATVQNFLDRKNIVGVNPSTGQPDLTGLEGQLSVSPSIPTLYRTDGSAATSFPVAVVSLTENFRDRFAQNDLNSDGQITLEEAQTNLRRALSVTASTASFLNGSNGDSPFNYGVPRLFRFGVDIRF